MRTAYQIARFRTGAEAYEKDYEKEVEGCISTFDAGSTKQATQSAGRCAGESACAYFSGGTAPTGVCGDIVSDVIGEIFGDAEEEEKKRREQAAAWDKYFGAENALKSAWEDYVIALYNQFFRETKQPPYELQRLLNKHDWPPENIVNTDKFKNWQNATVYGPVWWLQEPLRFSVGMQPGYSSYDANKVTSGAWRKGYDESLLRLAELQRTFKRAFMRATIAPVSKAVAQKYSSKSDTKSGGLLSLVGLGALGFVLIKVLR